LPRHSADLLEFIKQTSLLTWRVGDDGHVVDLPEWCVVTGQTAAEVEGEGWMNALHPDDVDRARMAWRTAVAHGSPYSTDYRLRCADGIYRWVNSRGIAIFERDGTISHWVGAVFTVPGVMRPSQSNSGTRAGQRAFSDIMPAALRAARAMLNWSSERLAKEAGVSLSTVRRLEAETTSAESFRRSSVEKILTALTDSGLRLIGSGSTAVGVEVTEDWHPPA